MTEGEHCSECGKKLPRNGPETICPDCLRQYGPGRNGARPVPSEEAIPEVLATSRMQSFASPFSVRNRRQGVRKWLLGPGIGLLVTGLISVALGVTVHVFAWPESNRLFSALATMSLVSGPVILCGAVSLPRLEFLWLVRLSSWLALLPCGFGWVVGLPAGLWTLAALARPEVQAAFQHRQAEYDAEQDQILDEVDADLRDS